MNIAIQTLDLSKSFLGTKGAIWNTTKKPGIIQAVNKVNLTVTKGEIFGLLGTNGAGKTTLIKLLSTLVLPTSGNAIVNGFNLNQEIKIKSSIGLSVADERSFYWRLTVRQNLEFFQNLHHVLHKSKSERINEVLNRVGLNEHAEQRFMILSTGMRQRLSLARALLHSPSILFLDEPTRSLDPSSTRIIQELILDLVYKNPPITVFLATNDLQEAEKLCHRIAIMDKGVIRACGTMNELRNEINIGDSYQILVDGLPHTVREKLKIELDVSIEDNRNELTGSKDNPAHSNGIIRFESKKGERKLDKILDQLRANQVEIESIDRMMISLDKIFQRYTSSIYEDDRQIKQLQPAISKNLFGSDFIAKNKKTHNISSKHIPYLGLSIVTAFLKRDFITELSYPISFFLQFLGIFFQVGVFYFISKLLGNEITPYLTSYGGDYFPFVLIGIAIAGYFGVGLSSFASRLRQAQTNGTLEAMLTSPTRVSAIIILSSLWDYIMTTFRLLVYLVIGYTIAGLPIKNINWSSVGLVFILTIAAFSSLGILAASFIMVLKRGDPITWIINAFSSLLGGIYFPISVLPDWLQTISKLLPITYSLEALRYALLSGYSFIQILPYILPLLGFCLLLLPLSLLAFRFAVDRARQDGSLTHY